MIVLPVVDRVPDKIIEGRNVHDGYVRGWGLQFNSDFVRSIREDEDYRQCLSVADGRTIQSELNRINLYLLIRFYLPRIAPGNIVEFGSYRGGSALFMAAAAKRHLPGTKVFGFDTFAGMPITDFSVDLHAAGDFSGVDLAELRGHADASGLDNLEFVQGLFQDTYPRKSDEIGPIALNHIDCDIRSAVAYSYEATKSRMVRGGYIAFDDSLASSCIGATEVVEKILVARDGLLSEQIFPHHVFRSGL